MLGLLDILCSYPVCILVKWMKALALPYATLTCTSVVIIKTMLLFIKVVMQLQLYFCIQLFVKIKQLKVYRQNNNERNATMSFHSRTVYGSDPSQDSTPSLTSLLHRSPDITRILPVLHTSVKTSHLGDSPQLQQFH